MANLLKLYYVEGISRTDTPLFDNIENQRQYYEDRRVVTIPDSFYPPHYRNEISLVLGDYYIPTESSQINYLSLEYLGRVYYYFIDSIQYKNEEIATLNVTMDVIQTYMFDINYHNARVTRETIKRWNGDYINRNYIRENYGSDVLVNKFYVDYTIQQKETGVVIAKTRRDNKLTAGIKPTIMTYYKENGETYAYSDGTFICAIPAPIMNNEYLNDFNPSIKFNDNTVNYNQIMSSINSLNEGYITFSDSTKKQPVIEMYYMPFISIGTITYDSVNNKYTFNYDEANKSGTKLIYSATEDGIVLYGEVYSSAIKGTEIQHTLDFEKNIPTYVNNKLVVKSFNKKYVPQLIDENYINFEFGEKIKTTSYPISKLITNKLYCYRKGDVFTGDRVYTIKDSQRGYDKYLTTITVNTKELLCMFNDAWKNYYVGHQGSLMLTSALSTLKLVGGAYNLGMNNPRPIRKGQLTKKFRKDFDKNIVNNESYGNVLGLAETVINKKHTPDTQSQGNTYTSDVIANSLHTILKLDEVSNIDNVATIYESIGYAVDKFVQGNPLVQNRKLYNYIECETIDVTLRNCINDTDTIDLIEERYQDGIRFWNVDFLRDNNINLELGDVCIYDNVENE